MDSCVHLGVGFPKTFFFFKKTLFLKKTTLDTFFFSKKVSKVDLTYSTGIVTSKTVWEHSVTDKCIFLYIVQWCCDKRTPLTQTCNARKCLFTKALQFQFIQLASSLFLLRSPQCSHARSQQTTQTVTIR